jgi:hypothetical protein
MVQSGRMVNGCSGQARAIPRLGLAALVVLLGWTNADVARAQEALRFVPVPDGVNIDGMLREWGGVRMQRVGEGAAAMGYVLAYDDKGLYLAAQVRHEGPLVRTARPGPNEDAVVLTLVMPSGARGRPVEVWFFAGVPGRSPSVVGTASPGRAPRPASGARMVEAPLQRGNGYQFEAFVPWSVLPGSARWQRARGAIRLRDVAPTGRRAVRSEPASAPIDPRALHHLPALVVTGGPDDMLRAFMQRQGIAGLSPRADLDGDVAGDGRDERVVVVDRFVVVLGPGYREGKSYDFFELPVADGSRVRHAELADLTGDGKKELAVRLRQSNAQGSRDLWMVLGIRQQGIQPLWGVELRKATDDGHVEATLQIHPARRGAPVVEVRAGEAEGLGPHNLREAPARDVAPIPLPWGPVRARRYQWQGSAFAAVSEEPNPDYEPPAPARRATRARGRRRSAAPPPRPPSVREKLAEVRRREGIDETLPARFEQRANVIGDARPEHLVVFGHTLVAVGPGFGGGAGYFHMSLPVAEDRDLVDMGAWDVTGSGTKEVLFKLRQRFEGGVTRDLLLVYRFHDKGFERLLSVDVGRAHEGRRVQNLIRLVRTGRRHDIVIHPGRVRGWDAASWPFPPDDASDDVEPGLLPWRDDAPVRYTYTGSGFSRQ